MDWTTNVAVHESVAPELTRERILAALRRGELDASLLYGGLRQTGLWIALHQSVAPSQVDPEFASLYDRAFAETARICQGNVIHVVSLACGSGSKDVRAIRELRSAERAVIYTPADLSLEMVLESQRAAAREFRGLQITPLMCELSQCSVLPAILKSFDPSGAERLILCLGAIHNHWPPDILKSILYPLRSQDRLLIGVNLAPAENYNEAMERILRQYDNPPTRAWLFGALSELGLNQDDGDLGITLEEAESRPGLKRIEARFRFRRARELRIYEETLSFAKDATLRVFYSHRFTPEILDAFCQEAGLRVTDRWLLSEEGLFLCRRAGA
jgi:uncharacterized SAM-dependent methyltransferase